VPEILAPENVRTDATHFGIPVAFVDDDGDMIALGHHEPRRALAAFNRHARSGGGLTNLVGDRQATADEALGCIHQRWAIIRKPDPDNPRDDPEYAWIAEWVPRDTTGAQPVTTFEY
jgi:hypothetical protein